MVSDIQISSIAKVHSTISHMSEKITFILEEKSTIQSKSWHDNLNSVTFYAIILSERQNYFIEIPRQTIRIK